MLLKLSFTNVTRNRRTKATENWFHSENWFHKRYSKLLPLVVLEIDPEELLKITFRNVSRVRPTSVTQN